MVQPDGSEIENVAECLRLSIAAVSDKLLSTVGG